MASDPSLRGGFFWRLRRPAFVVFLAIFGTFSGGLFYLSRVALPTPTPQSQTTFVFDDSGHILATYKSQNRIDVSLSQVPKVVIQAVVSTEDRHFFTEGAINPISIVRALISDVRGQGSLQGGSTITQQYVKQAYLSDERTLKRKIKEVAIAIKLEHVESKDQILQGYLNTIYWGRGAYGVEAAAEAYFGKHVEQLGLPEASLLAALIREPETADPATNPALARTNQTDTLNAMVRDHKITTAQAAQVEHTPFASYVVSPNASRADQTNVPGADYFVAAVRSELLTKYSASEIDGGGLRVYTTEDPTMQTEAFNSVYGPAQPSLNPLAGDPSGALVSVDDHGDVRAMVGGEDFNRSQVNLAMGTAGGGSGRQAGSTFKAFMLAELIKDGYSVESTFQAPKEVVFPHGNQNGTAWDVKNFEGESPGSYLNLIDATAFSVNTVYAQVIDKLGAASLDQMAEACGVNPRELAAPYLSQVLGTADVSPLEMAAAYNTFADGGTYNRPQLITKITTANGTPLPLPDPPASHQVLTPQQDNVLNYVLQQVVLRGTGESAGGLGTPVAGKTGTTENSADAWFIGYTPKLTTAVWMGFPASSRPMVNFRGQQSVQGGGVPAQLWHAYMLKVLRHFPEVRGDFAPAFNLSGRMLTPPGSSTLVIPTTTTRPPPTTTTTRSIPTTTGTSPGPSG
ncbi:MAG: transglycosylase domain-containing protein [Acidimicrobiaceae bacterium]|nr:transglycosylase domain-containing protein [Acidimicrobiaceae bacterium]